MMFLVLCLLMVVIYLLKVLILSLLNAFILYLLVTIHLLSLSDSPDIPMQCNLASLHVDFTSITSKFYSQGELNLFLPFLPILIPAYPSILNITYSYDNLSIMTRPTIPANFIPIILFDLFDSGLLIYADFLLLFLEEGEELFGRVHLSNQPVSDVAVMILRDSDAAW